MSNFYIKELNFAIIQSVKNSYLYIKENFENSVLIPQFISKGVYLESCV